MKLFCLVRCSVRKELLITNVLFHPIFYSTKSSEPLRILFCGSDKFSIASLEAIKNEKEINPNLVKSIDVLCRPGKPVGRGMKKIFEAPIKAFAQNLGLTVHESDELTLWKLPRPEGEKINLIITVSFGLFIPAQILTSAKYGGLNLHPSILPNFRGPAPLQRTLLSNYRFTGVTLQTLDHEHFDRGIVIDQTKPWIEIPELCTYNQLLNLVSPIAATTLVKGLNQRLFVPPLIHVGWLPQANEKLTYAKKITQGDKMVSWKCNDGGKGIVQAYNALGSLWSHVYVNHLDQKRFKFNCIKLDERIEICLNPGCNVTTLLNALSASIGGPIRFIVVPTLRGEKQAILYFKNSIHRGYINFLFPCGASQRVWSSITVGEITIEGKPTTTAQSALNSIVQEEGIWSLSLSKISCDNEENLLLAFPLQDS